jgi:hypothetical protein
MWIRQKRGAESRQQQIPMAMQSGRHVRPIIGAGADGVTWNGVGWRPEP